MATAIELGGRTYTNEYGGWQVVGGPDGMRDASPEECDLLTALAPFWGQPYNTVAERWRARCLKAEGDLTTALEELRQVRNKYLALLHPEAG